MVRLTNVQGALLDSIIRMRKRNLSILSNIKTEDLNKLNNYPAFMACLHDFNARIASV